MWSLDWWPIFIGASPVGLIDRKCWREALLEIKWSITFHKQRVWRSTVSLYSDVRTEVSSLWYVKFQWQMGVCQMRWCGFVFNIWKGLAHERIYYDPKIQTNHSKMYAMSQKVCHSESRKLMQFVLFLSVVYSYRF